MSFPTYFNALMLRTGFLKRKNTNKVQLPIKLRDTSSAKPSLSPKDYREKFRGKPRINNDSSFPESGKHGNFFKV